MFKVGDKVRGITEYPQGDFTIVDIDGEYLTVDGVGGGFTMGGWSPWRFELIKEPKKASPAAQGCPSSRHPGGTLEPVPTLVLKHLAARSTISPIEALASYGIFRLAAAIHELRKHGYQITTTLKKDAAGHQYARYKLAA